MKDLSSNLDHLKPRLPTIIIGVLMSTFIFMVLSTMTWRVGGLWIAVIAQMPLMVVTALYKKIDKPFALILFWAVLLLCLLDWKMGIAYGGLVLVPTVMFVKQALQFKKDGSQVHWYPLNRLVSEVGLFALGIGGLYWLLWNPMGFGAHTLSMILEQLHSINLFSIAQQQHLETHLQRIWPYMPGFFSHGFIMMTVASAAGAQRWIRTSSYPAPRADLKLSTLELPWWCWKSLAFLGFFWVIAVQFHFTFASLIGVGCLTFLSLFALQGLAIIHTFAKKQKNTHLFLVIFYICVIVFEWLLFLLVIAGILEPWLNLRNRINNKE